MKTTFVWLIISYKFPKTIVIPAFKLYTFPDDPDLYKFPIAPLLFTADRCCVI